MIDSVINNVFQFIPQIFTVTITAIITNIISKCINRKPNEKLELSYNRIYYPLYKLIIENQTKDNADIDYYKVRDSLEYRLRRYGKYANITTIKAFVQFSNAINESDSKTYKKLYKSMITENILNQSAKMRKILGYPEATTWQYYKYSTKRAKFQFRIVMYIFVIYFLVTLCGLTQNYINGIIDKCVGVILMVIIICIIDMGGYILLNIFIPFIKKKFCKIFNIVLKNKM